MEKLENRNNIRLNNQIMVLNLLRQEKMTITDLAERLEVSFSAARHIIDEMVEGGILKYSSKQAVNPRGRTPVFVELNTKQGVICGVDLSTTNIQIIIASIDGSTYISDYIYDVTFINKDHFTQIEEKIKLLLKRPEIKGRPLLSICISSPGIINPKTFEYVVVYRVKDYDRINPVAYFSSAFNCKVSMYNDVRIGCLAELKKGIFPKQSFNGAFLHIGTGAGICFVINGKIYEGSHGFAGESPFLDTKDPLAKEAEWNNRIYSLWEIANRINEIKGLDHLPVNHIIDQKKLVEDYKNGDKITVQAVEEACKRNALTIIGFSTLFDLDMIVIEGPILQFGDEIINKIIRYVNEISLYSIRTIICASTIGQTSSITGACYQAVSTYLYDALERLNQKRLNDANFKINPAFNDI